MNRIAARCQLGERTEMLFAPAAWIVEFHVRIVANPGKNSESKNVPL
jgi:hypothetical protein